MGAKNFQACFLPIDGYSCLIVLNLVLWHAVGQISNVFAARFSNQFFQGLVFFILYQYTTRFYFINENNKLVEVNIKSGKHIDMVPGYAG